MPIGKASGLIPQETCPARVFGRLWVDLTSHEVADVHRAADATESVDPHLIAEIDRALRCDEPGQCTDALRRMITPTGDPHRDRVIQLAVMQRIDSQFMAIHPRAIRSTASGMVAIPMWLQVLDEKYAAEGCFACVDRVNVVPNGPLRRCGRDPDADYGFTLAGQFASLAVVPSLLQHDERNIPVDHKVIGFDDLEGVARGTTPIGEVRVGFVPIATQRTDLTMTMVPRDDRLRIQYELNGLDPVHTMLRALEKRPELDIVAGSELTMPQADMQRLAQALGRSSLGARLIVAGSGLSADLRDGLPYNEAWVLNTHGKLLWSQRKLWPSGIDANRARDLGLTPPVRGIAYEDTGCGTRLVIVDVLSIGRIAVLICQDLTMETLTTQLLRAYQPDYVISPILDVGVREGRWAHQRAAAINGHSLARFIVASSTAVADALDAGTVPCGMAVGPRIGDAPSPDRATAFVTDDLIGVIDWSNYPWQQTVLGVTPAK